MVTRSEAQQRVDEIEAFRRELERLRQEKVLALPEEQAHAVAHHHDALIAELSRGYDIDRNVREKKLSLGMKVASFLGALALAASVFFLFRQFWGLFGTFLQVSILVGAALFTFAGTLLVRERDASGYFTKLAAMVAFTCFVLNVFMLGQIFSITPSDKAFIAWAAYALLLAYACDLRLLLAAGILCLVAFVSARTGTYSGLYWLHFGERPENFFPAAMLLLLAPLWVRHERYAGFSAIYRVFGLLTLFLPTLVLANWGRASHLDIDPKMIEGIYQLFGFAGSAAAIWFGLRRVWPEVVNTGMVFFVIFLYTKFFDWWWDVMPKYLFFLVVGLTAILFLMVMRRLRRVAAPADREGAVT
ncbi:MAG: DUF2157 domain-containing protein [Betaproteobacteria bacterium HGW-Betaproteobacteria-14]|nr:MAG: DUF2157 domain-containing protein [Betaproteobacteria bacterium HGW-Betaproteobacteria-14]